VDQDALARTELAELSKLRHAYRPAGGPADEVSHLEQRIDEIVSRLFATGG
jgi:hypothetical protein